MKRAVLAAIFGCLSGPRAGRTTSNSSRSSAEAGKRSCVRMPAVPRIVHFWGVTCGPCKVELPLLGKFMKEHPRSTW